jgi:putative cardiolipin synthase
MPITPPPPQVLPHAPAGDGQDVALAGSFRLLRSNREAFAARVALIRTARQRLDLQYYIARADRTGTWLAAELLAAADRGVAVRLLLDDRADPARDANLRALDQHPQVEIRLFNPLRERDTPTARLVGFLRALRRLNRRMHNKALVADDRHAIVGGRNLGDEYFGADPSLEFLDLDVLAEGPVVGAVAAAFATYWRSRWAIPIAALVAPPAAGEVEALRSELAAAFLAIADPDREAAVVRVIAALTPGTGLAPATPPAPRHTGQARLLVDDPRKIASWRRRHADAPSPRTLVPEVMAALGSARERLLVVSPYFVPGRQGTAEMVAIARRGVRVSVLTNSLAATDVAAVHAGYRRYRPDLLAGGVELFELAPEPARRRRLRVAGASRASLHAKAFLVDDARLFVGSFNFDPRSARLNTEMGLLIDSPSLAREAASFLARGLAAEASWRLERTGAGQLVWHGGHRGAPMRFTREPMAPFARRLLVALLSWLPIESQL